MTSSYKHLYGLMFKLLSPSSTNHLSILIYHRVLGEKDEMRPGELTRREFSEQMKWISEYLNPLPLNEALTKVRSGSLPDRSIAVTFDDGYADNEEVALPIMQKYSIPATVFVAPGFLNGGRMWNDTIIEFFRVVQSTSVDLRPYDLTIYSCDSWQERRQSAYALIAAIKYFQSDKRDEVIDYLNRLAPELPNDLMMTSDQVRALRNGGVEIGAHTCNHPILTEISSDKAFEEISNSKSVLEDILSEPVRYFAYPNGKPDRDYSFEHRNMVKKLGFEAALSTQWGVTDASTDPWQLPRYTPWNRSRAKFLLQILRNSRNVYRGIQES